MSPPTLSHFCCASSIYAVFVAYPCRRVLISPLPSSIIHGRPFPECARSSFDQVFPTRVEPLLSVSGGRACGVGSVSSQLLTAAPAISLSHSISHFSIYATHVYPFLPPRSVDGCPSPSPTTMSFSHTSSADGLLLCLLSSPRTNERRSSGFWQYR